MFVNTGTLNLYFLENYEKTSVDTRMLKEDRGGGGGYAACLGVLPNSSPVFHLGQFVSGHVVSLGDVIEPN